MQSSESILEVNLDIIKENYLTLCKYAKNSNVAAVLKADAYGVGMKYVASIISKSGCKDFFVSSPSEGTELRNIIGNDANIYVLHGVFHDEIQYLLDYNLIPVLNSFEQINMWQKLAFRLGKTLPCIIHIDTGMNRLGMNEEEWKFFNQEKMAKNLEIKYIMSHLSSSDKKTNSSNKNQLDKFEKCTKKFPSTKRSLANSGGILLGKEYHFDMVRVGAGLYGLNISPYMEKFPLKNPFKISSPIIQISNLKPGESVGYNNTYINNSNSNCKIATVPVGYADGIIRSMGNKGSFYINKYKTPIIGMVSMDLTVIDVSKVPNKYLKLGQDVEIMGNNNTPDKIAQDCMTNAYEILTIIGSRYKKVYSSFTD